MLRQRQTLSTMNLRERDETKYLRQIEVPMLQLETTVKGCRFASLNVYSYYHEYGGYNLMT